LSVVNFSGFDFASCLLFRGTSDFAARQVVVGDADVVVSDLSLQGALTFTQPTTVKLECGTAYTTGAYVDPGATLTATSVAPADLVVAYDTKTTLPDAGATPLTVFHEKMAAGAWRVSSAQTAEVSNPNGSIGGSTDFVRCTLFAGKQAIDGGATVLIS